MKVRFIIEGTADVDDDWLIEASPWDYMDAGRDITMDVEVQP